MTTDSSSLKKHSQSASSPATVGILGGMGPWASMEFLRKVLQEIHVEKDWDYPRIIMDSNTQIPSRSRCYLYGEMSPVAQMIDSCHMLENYHVDCIAIPCNSAQAWISEVQTEVHTPILNIYQSTMAELQGAYPATRSVIVLGGCVTHGLRVYEPYARDAGFSYIELDRTLQNDVESFIECAKRNAVQSILFEKYHELIRKIIQLHGVDVSIILGCTEFGMVETIPCACPVVDSSTAYARHVAHTAMKGWKP